MTSLSDSNDGCCHIQGKEVAIDYGLQLVPCWVVKLEVNGRQQAIQDLAGNNDALLRGSYRMVVGHHQQSIPGNSCHIKIALHVLHLCDLL